MLKNTRSRLSLFSAALFAAGLGLVTMTSPKAPPAREPSSDFEPTELHSMQEAEELFRALPRASEHSQSHDRQQVWASELQRRFGTRSLHVFLFYTERFRSKYTQTESAWLGLGDDEHRLYRWWFTSAPLVRVGNQEIVLDRQFFDRPVTLEEWSRHFIALEPDPTGLIPTADAGIPRLSSAEAHCRTIENLAELTTQSTEDWCMIRKVPMYYHQPLDVACLDNAPTDWSTSHWGSRSTGMAAPNCRTPVLHEFDAAALELAKKRI